MHQTQHSRPILCGQLGRQCSVPIYWPWLALTHQSGSHMLHGLQQLAVMQLVKWADWSQSSEVTTDFLSKSSCLVCSPESDLSFFLPGRKGKINWRIYAIYASTFSYWKMNLNLDYDSNFLNLGSGWRSRTNRKCSQEARSSTSGQALSSGNDSCTFQLYESLNCSNTDRSLWK